MKVFLKQILTFCVVIMVIPFSLFLIPREMYQGGNYVTWQAVFAKRNEPNLSRRRSVNLVIGDSKSQFGLNAKFLNSVNFSLSGTTPVEGFFLLKNLISQKIRIDTIYLSYGAHHLYHQDTFYPYAVYYEMIDKDDIEKVLTSSKELNDINYSEITRLQKFKSVYNTTNSLELAIYSQRFFDFMKFGLGNMLSYETDKERCLSQFENGYCVIDKSNRAIGDSDVETPEFVFETKELGKSFINRTYLDSLRILSKKHNIILFYVIMPVPTKSIRPDSLYFRTYEAFIVQKFGKNILKDSLFYPNKYFMDASHLNKTGVKHFSERICGIFAKHDSL